MICERGKGWAGLQSSTKDDNGGENVENLPKTGHKIAFGAENPYLLVPLNHSSGPVP